MKMKKIYCLPVCISLFVAVNLQAQSQKSFFEALPDNCFVTPDTNAAPAPVPLNILHNDELGFCGVSDIVVRITEPARHGTIAMDATDSENKIAVIEGDFNILYVPDSGYMGQDTLKYTIECNGLISNPALVLINVTDTPDNMQLDICFVASEGVDWSIREVLSAGAVYCNYVSPVVGDFDGNGIPDIIVVRDPSNPSSTNRYANKIAMLEVNEAGAIVEKKVINTGSNFRWDGFGNGGLISTQINGRDTTLFIQVMQNFIVKAFNYNGDMVWESNPLTMTDSSNGLRGTLGFADFNQDGIPEAYYDREIIDTQDGHIICTIPDGGAAQLSLASLAADLYGTGKLSYVWGSRVYDFVDGPTPALVAKTAVNNQIGNTIHNMQYRFPIAIDMDGDGRLELAIVTSRANSTGVIYVIDPVTGIIKASSAAYNVGGYGVSYPFAGDIDGDGRSEIVIMTRTTINAYKYNDTNQLQLLWAWTHQDGSALTGITLFDFNQDGKAELVYRDEQHLRIIDGSTNPPRELANFVNRSGTGSEYPLVADIDNDKQAEIISVGNQTSATYTGQVRIYKSGSSNFPWAPARKVWNQFAYNPVYVHDNLSIVRHPLNPATKFVDKEGAFVQPYNNILQQATLLSSEGKMLSYGADISVLRQTDGKTPFVEYSYDIAENYDLKVTVHLANEGDNVFPDTISVSVYVWEEERFLPIFSAYLPLLNRVTGAKIVPPLKVGDEAKVEFTLKDIIRELFELEQVENIEELQINELLQIRLNEKNNKFIVPECTYYNDFIGGANLYGTPPIVMCDGEERSISMHPENGGYVYVWCDDSFQIIAKGPSITIQKTEEIQKYYVRVYDLDGNWVNRDELTKGPKGYYEVTVYSPAGKLIWTGGAGSSDWNDHRNWYNPSPQYPFSVINIPRTCTDVLIPATASYFPNLKGGVTTHDIYPNAACNEIRFEFGGEVARTDSLHYSKAYIQYDFGYYDSKGGRLETATTVKRDRWYALSAPLQKIVTGDFSFGGHPDTWQMGFSTDGNAATVTGHWKLPGNTNDIELRSLNQAIALRVAGSHSDSIGSDYQLGYQRSLNLLNGVLEFPYFEGSNERSFDKEPHRIHKYEKGASYFSYYISDIASQPLLPEPLGKINRSAEAYRFIFDENRELVNGRNVFKLSVPAGKYLMVGNPFMSTFDFKTFYDFNGSAKLENYFYLFDGANETFELHNAGNNAIAVLQAFFIKTKGSGNIDLYFPFEASVVRTSASHELKSSSFLLSPSSVLRVFASHNEKISSASLYLNEEYGENIRKLFYEGSEAAPQIYFTDEDENRNEIQYFALGKTEISLGVRVEKGASVNLLFSNLENLPVKSLYLVDKETGKKQNLLEENSYPFAGTSENSYNDRFVLEVGTNNPTLIEEAKVSVYQMNNRLTIYSSQEIRNVELFDIQGRKIVHASPAGNVLNIPVDGLRGVYIIKSVFSNGEVKVTKTIIK
jgi:hypothetical protein